MRKFWIIFGAAEKLKPKTADQHRHDKKETYHVLFHVRADDTATSHLDLEWLQQNPAS